MRYVSSVLAKLAKDEVLIRLGHGRYAINAHHERLRGLRFRKLAQSEFEMLKAERRLIQSRAEA